jgi:hypothetical protein
VDKKTSSEVSVGISGDACDVGYVAVGEIELLVDDGPSGRLNRVAIGLKNHQLVW